MDCKKKPEPCLADTFIGYMGDLGVNALFNAESETSATGVDPAVLRGIGYCAGIAQSAFDEPRDFTPEELNAVVSYAMRCEEEFKSKGRGRLARPHDGRRRPPRRGQLHRHALRVR